MDKIFIYNRALILISSVIIFFVLCHNLLNPSIFNEIVFCYNDSHFAASVAHNVAIGKGFSYWDGFQYNFLDPDISTGPTVILPLSLALYMGMDYVRAFNFVPLFFNVSALSFLLFIFSKKLNKVNFSIFCISISIFVLSFQRWQWYLPLGEVPAAIFFLISSAFFCHDSRKSGLFLSGMFFAISILSKMLVTLAIPVFILVFLYKKNFQGFFKWSMGNVFVFSLYFIFLMLSFPGGILDFFYKFYDYVLYSFWFAFSGAYSGYSGFFGDFSGLNLAKMNFINADIWGDLSGFFQYSYIISLFFFLCFSIFRRKNELFIFYFLCASSFFIISLWYFFGGLHTGRYFFIPGFILFFSYSFLFSGMGNKMVLFIATMIFIPAYFFIVRGIVFPYKNDGFFIAERDMQSLSVFVKNRGLTEFMADPDIFEPYPSVSYYLGADNRFYALNAYVDRNAVVLSPANCGSTAVPNPLSFSIGMRNSISFKCSFLEGGELKMRWKDSFEGGYYLTKWQDSDSSSGAAYRHCADLLFHGSYMRLYWCDRREISSLVYSQSGRKINIE
jgi:hypothetical protein